MVPGDRPELRIAAGLDEQTFGTDAMAVADAITAVDGPDGVLVLLDLGSAVLSAEMALELVDPELHDRVRLSPAPLVEGLVAAVVLAAGGASLDEAAAEAARGLAAKQEHLGVATEQPEQVAPAAEREVELVVSTPHGLHARPAARLVALARQYDAGLTLADLETGRGPVDAGSLSMVATLNVQQGHRIRIGASGPRAEAALTAVTELAAQNFGDIAVPEQTGDARPAVQATNERRHAGAVATNERGFGLEVAIGPAVVAAGEVDLGGYLAGDAATEEARSEAAVDRAVAALRAIRATTGQRVGEAEAAIFDAHLALLDDPAVTRAVAAAIAGGASAPEAWAARLDALAAEFGGLDDAYQRERAQDVRAVRRRILAELARADRPDVASEEPSAIGHGSSDARGVLVVAELDAATAATIDAGEVAGVATRAGGATGHGVIVARSRGIPIVTGIGDVAVEDGQLVAFDGRAGRFVVEPDEEEFRGLIERRTAERDEAVRHAGEPAVTTDGHTVRVFANVGSVADAHAAARLGADGAGLVRTEVLFGDRGTAPAVDEQAAVYREISTALGGRPVTIRTWDVGGDKPLPFLPLPAEANPFLGERGLRVFRHRPELLTDQLDAICRVAREAPIRVMFPMVTTAEEVGWARRAAGLARPAGGARGRHHGRGACRRAEGRAPRRRPGLRQHRHQRPDPVRHRRRPRQHRRARHSPTGWTRPC